MSVSATLNVARSDVFFAPNGAMFITLVYTNLSGVVVSTRSLLIPADLSVVRDMRDGTIVAQPPPVALTNAITTFLTQVDATIANAVTANKLNP